MPATTPQIANTEPTEMSMFAGQDHQRHPDRDDQHRHVAEEQIAEVLAREVARRDRRQHEAERGDDDDD